MKTDLRATLYNILWNSLIDLSADSVALRQDCADIKADLELHYLHTSEDLFLVLSHIDNSIDTWVAIVHGRNIQPVIV